MSNKLVFLEHPTYNNESVVSDHGTSYVAMTADQFNAARGDRDFLVSEIATLREEKANATTEFVRLTADYKRASVGWLESEIEVARLETENQNLQDSLKFSRSVNTSFNAKITKLEDQRDALIRALDKMNL